MTVREGFFHVSNEEIVGADTQHELEEYEKSIMDSNISDFLHEYIEELEVNFLHYKGFICFSNILRLKGSTLIPFKNY